MDIPSERWGEGSELLVFCHANGYPPSCYHPLLEKLSVPDRTVLAPHMRALWLGSDPMSLSDWRPLSTDLASFLDQHADGPVVAVGHSVGGIQILRLAMWQPERFKAIILLDPVLFPMWMVLQWNLMYSLGIAYRVHPLVAAADRRRRTYDSRQAVFESYRRKPIFRHLDDAALQTMVAGMFTEDSPGGPCHLAQPSAWEQRIYVTGIRRDLELWRGLPALKLPLLILRGAETDTFWADTAHRVQHLRPQSTIRTLDAATHLVPLERPAETSRAIEAFLKEHL